MQLSLNPGRKLLIAPEIILSATSVKNVTSCGSHETTTNPVINSSAVVIFNKDQVRSSYCRDERIRIVFKEFGTETFIRSLEKEIEGKNTLDSELKQISNSVIITKASVNLKVPGAQKKDGLVITGLYQVVVEKEQTIVKIDNLESDLELFLIQAHGVPVYKMNFNLLEMSNYGRNRVEITLPSEVIQSSVSLSSQLTSLGIIDPGSSVYHQTSLKFLPQVRQNLLFFGNKPRISSLL